MIAQENGPKWPKANRPIASKSLNLVRSDWRCLRVWCVSSDVAFTAETRGWIALLTLKSFRSIDAFNQAVCNCACVMNLSFSATTFKFVATKSCSRSCSLINFTLLLLKYGRTQRNDEIWSNHLAKIFVSQIANNISRLPARINIVNDFSPAIFLWGPVNADIFGAGIQAVQREPKVSVCMPLCQEQAELRWKMNTFKCRCCRRTHFPFAQNIEIYLRLCLRQSKATTTPATK